LALGLEWLELAEFVCRYRHMLGDTSTPIHIIPHFNKIESNTPGTLKNTDNS
jgi:hypothetical protein